MIKHNQFWRLRKSHGRKPIFSSPQQLWQRGCEYLQWVDEHPLKQQKLVGRQFRTVTVTRPYTVSGLCYYLRISEETFRNYARQIDYEPVATMICLAIKEQQLTGAATFMFNGNIVSRLLGLKDSNELSIKHDLQKLLTQLNTEGKLTEEALICLASLVIDSNKSNLP
jgi:hypothetical protein